VSASRVLGFALLQLVIYGPLLLIPAGTLLWGRAWVLLGILVVGTIATMRTAFSDNEGLLAERLKPPIQRGQPLADKIILLALILTFVGMAVLSPLDVFRLHLLPAPGWPVSLIGLVMFGVGWWIISLAFKENAFAAPVVKYQGERGQHVIDTGVYAIVRHPMYIGGLLFFIGMPLWLGSYAATIVAILTIPVLVARILVEERFLRRTLTGYDAYAARVRYRLIPGLW
jgi:protein-S-isoprenylcysteine O-methyltransferase Ste14